TFTVEGVNADLRHYIPFLARRCRCFPGSIEILKVVVEVFVNAYNQFSKRIFFKKFFLLSKFYWNFCCLNFTLFHHSFHSFSRIIKKIVFKISNVSKAVDYPCCIVESVIFNISEICTCSSTSDVADVLFLFII
ncbi:MAG: hypothetical protein K2J39_10090, partial [Ruminococcus sp.]|nr:hypothetical protein [Ruminococcus sp.]